MSWFKKINISLSFVVCVWTINALLSLHVYIKTGDNAPLGSLVLSLTVLALVGYINKKT